jgi:hypothetical protein
MQQIVLAGTLTGNAGFKLLLCIASLVGLFFGLYYTVFALLPVTLVTTLVCWASAMANGGTISSASLEGLVAAIGLQGGFMIGLTGRDVVGQLVSRVKA